MTSKGCHPLLSIIVLCAVGMAIAQAETVTYYATDHLGSPVAAMDSSGSVIWRESYSPYGENIEGPSGADNDTGYTGHQFDAATDLTYMQARYYDPVIGRFMAVDPIPFNPELPWTFSRYSYVRNNPTNLVDPTGECTVDEDGKITDCEIIIEDEEDLTDDQKRLIDEYLRALTEAGKAIQDSDDGGSQTAWANIKSITFIANKKYPGGKSAPATNKWSAETGEGHITYWSPSFNPSYPADLRSHISIHEIFHSHPGSILYASVNGTGLMYERHVDFKAVRFYRQHLNPEYINRSSGYTGVGFNVN